MKRAGLIGNPVSHSRSPQMHNAAFAALYIDAVYELWHTEVDEIPDRVASIRADGMLGANVTVPHKQAVMPWCDELTETARRAGAVNTIIPRNGHLLGDNTDVFGFACSVQEATSADATPSSHALLLGAGGAARAVIVALQEMGIRQLTIANRTVAKARKLAAELGGSGAMCIDVVALDELDSSLPGGVDLLVNSTAIGWHDNEIPLAPAILATLVSNALVVDLTYRETALLKTARAQGNPVLDGSGMLLYQGVRAFELWTGETAPVGVMRAALGE